MAAISRLTDDLRGRALLGARILAVAVAYYAGTYVSVFTIPTGLPVTSLWISSGIALFCLLVFDIRIWPGIVIGSFISNISAVPPLEAVLVAMGNTLAPVCAYVLLRRVGFRMELDRIRDGLALVLLGAFGAMTVSACVGTAALVSAGVWPASKLPQVWTVWWSSDVLGVLAMTPVLIVLRRLRQVRSTTWWRWFEFAAFLAAAVATTIVGTRYFGELFFAFPLVVLAALRFQLNGVAPCALIVSAIAINAAARDSGPFEGHSLLTNVMLLQVFNGTLVLTGLLIAVVITQLQQTRAEIERTYLRLADVVESLQQRMLPDTHYVESLRSLRHTTRRSRRSDLRAHDR